MIFTLIQSLYFITIIFNVKIPYMFMKSGKSPWCLFLTLFLVLLFKLWPSQCYKIFYKLQILKTWELKNHHSLQEHTQANPKIINQLIWNTLGSIWLYSTKYIQTMTFLIVQNWRKKNYNEKESQLILSQNYKISKNKQNI